MAAQKDMEVTAGEPVDITFDYQLNGVAQNWTDPKGQVRSHRGGTLLLDLDPFLVIQADPTKVKLVVPAATTAGWNYTGEFDIWDDSRRLFYGRFKTVKGATQ